jgi:U3 small nucleolar RNA-associated protein 4
LTKGVDRTLAVLSFRDSIEKLRVIPPVPQKSVVSLAPKARFLLSWSDTVVKAWKIEEGNTAGSECDEQISKRYLLEMEFNVPISISILLINQEEENISTATISPNGEYLLVATLSHSKLLLLVPDEATSKINLHVLGVFPYGARLATFTSAGDAIILVTPDSEVQIHPFLDQNAPTTKIPYMDKKSFINHIAVSPEGSEFITSASDSTLVIHSLDSETPPQMLPQPSSPITSLAFLSSDLVSITLADRNRLLLLERSGNEWVLHPWCQDEKNMPHQIGITMDKCLGTFVVNDDISRIWLWGANWLAWIQPNEGTSQSKGTGKKRSGAEGEKDSLECLHWITYRYREVLLVDCVGTSDDKCEFVVVERPRLEILEDVQEPRFYRHEYGT